MPNKPHAVRSYDEDDTNCCNKLRFRSRKIAASSAKRMSKELGEPIQPYHCDVHHCWHVGHEPGWKRSQREETKTVTTSVAMKKMFGGSGQRQTAE